MILKNILHNYIGLSSATLGRQKSELKLAKEWQEFAMKLARPVNFEILALKIFSAVLLHISLNETMLFLQLISKYFLNDITQCNYILKHRWL